MIKIKIDSQSIFIGYINDIPAVFRIHWSVFANKTLQRTYSTKELKRPFIYYLTEKKYQ